MASAQGRALTKNITKCDIGIGTSPSLQLFVDGGGEEGGGRGDCVSNISSYLFTKMTTYVVLITNFTSPCNSLQIWKLGASTTALMEKTGFVNYLKIRVWQTTRISSICAQL